MERWPPHLSPAERAALRDFIREARLRLGGEIFEIRLFGSRARGEGDEDSDLDVAVVVTPAGRARRRELYDAACDAMLAHGPQIIPLVIEADRLAELRAGERRIARDIDREGVPL